MSEIGLARDISIGGSSRVLNYVTIETAVLGNTTIFTPAAGRRFHIMKLLLSAAGPGVVNIRALSGINFILGGAAAGISLYAQGGYVESSDVMPILVGINADEPFILNLDANVPVGGHVVWYET